MFSIDITGVMSQAAVIFNQLFPAFSPVIGIRFGIALVLLVMAVIITAVTSIKK